MFLRLGFLVSLLMCFFLTDM